MTNLSDGFYPEILKLMKARLNISVKQYTRKDGKWGGIDRDTGKWNGMISNIIDGSADIILTCLTVSGKRPEIIDFLHPLSTKFVSFSVKGTNHKASWKKRTV